MDTEKLAKNVEIAATLFKGKRARIVKAILEVGSATYSSVAAAEGITVQQARNILNEMFMQGALRKVDEYPVTFLPNRDFINKASKAVNQVSV